MVFSSLLFLYIYLPVVLAVYYIVPVRWRNVWLFIVNLVFYGWGEPVYILLMLVSIGINYASGLLIDKCRDRDKTAKLILAGSTVLSLSLLLFFKYFDLFAETLNQLPFLSIPLLHLTLPIGISFYTFQTMSYPIDVYRGDAHVQKNIISFGTFVALFPQLIAGPIVRYKDVADQLDFRAGSAEQFASGVQRFVIGLGKKVLIANNIGMLWDIYAAQDAASLTFLGAWLGILAFSFQIYFDFSGYSDMAIGLGRMIGFEFRENFNYPYISKSVTEFWRRWHISLSTWFRDYVYIPLGGNRRGLRRQFLNILIVWALTGIWHGASWTFLLWGLYYAIFLVAEKAFLLKRLEKAPVLGHIYTLFVAVCGWVLFQTASLHQAAVFYRAMFGFGSAGMVGSGDLYYLANFALLFILAAVACTPLAQHLYSRLSARFKGLAAPAMIVLVMLLSTAYLVDATYNPFLYFRF
jgi:alginate O-acetyltransferase complex protein AlgI